MTLSRRGLFGGALGALLGRRLPVPPAVAAPLATSVGRVTVKLAISDRASAAIKKLSEGLTWHGITNGPVHVREIGPRLSVPDVERFIARLRSSHPDMARIFLNGSCWELYEILRTVWPKAQPWYSQAEGHVYVRIGRWWYDIRGRHRRPPQDARSMTAPGGYWPGDPPHRWSPRTRLRIVELGEVVSHGDVAYWGA